MKPHSSKIISVTGGKGGIGKTSIAINLAIALAKEAYQKVLLVDADLGLANVDVMLGLRQSKNISHVFKQECSIEDIIVKGPYGVDILPASNGNPNMSNLSPSAVSGILELFLSVKKEYDVILIDTAAGISDSVMGLTKIADEILVVVCNEPTSFADAYTVIKLLNLSHGVKKVRVLVNKVKTIEEGHEVFAKLTKVSDRFLQVNLNLFGIIPNDFHMLKAIQKQKSVLDIFPDSKSADKFRQLANGILKWKRPIDLGSRNGNYEIQVL